MDSRRKISVRKIIQTLVTLIVVTGGAMAMVSADRLQNGKHIRHVDIRIQNDQVVHFLDKQQLMQMLFADRHLDPAKISLAKLDMHKIEGIAKSNPWVNDAQAYLDNELNLHIQITQRIPVVRIFETDGNSYYLDTALQALPLSGHYVHYTTVVTNVPALRDDSAGRALKGQIIGLVDYVAKHKFWNAQIAQIVLLPDQTFQLIPVLGKQRILLGDTSRLEEKLGHLFEFYRQVLSKVGWDKYETLDLRFEGQVVAAPRLPWKAPVDKALSNMNWVQAIMDEAGKKDSKTESFANGAGPMTDTLADNLPPKLDSAARQRQEAPKPHHDSTVTAQPRKPSDKIIQEHHLPNTTNHLLHTHNLPPKQ